MATVAAENTASSVGAIFVKNLDKTIGNVFLHDYFSRYGKIISCTAVLDEESNCKGYGIVHFETEESAERAIRNANGMEIMNKELLVVKYQPRPQKTDEFTNVFVKNFGEDLDDEGLKEIFEGFGEITSCKVMTDSEGKSKGFGFIAFDDSVAAEQAVEMMHGYICNGKKLFVSRAQTKSERQEKLKKKHEEQKNEEKTQFPGVNLYVKNFGENLDNEGLKELFKQFGNIISAKVMTHESGRPKGFGFVCFEKLEDAMEAIKVMNSKEINGKLLYVTIAERKEDRRTRLANQFMQCEASLRMLPRGIPPVPMYAPGHGGYFAANTIQTPYGFIPTVGTAVMRLPMAPYGGMMMQGQQYGLPYPMQMEVHVPQTETPRPVSNESADNHLHQQISLGAASPSTGFEQADVVNPVVAQSGSRPPSVEDHAQSSKPDARPSTAAPLGSPLMHQHYYNALRAQTSICYEQSHISQTVVGHPAEVASPKAESPASSNGLGSPTMYQQYCYMAQQPQSPLTFENHRASPTAEYAQTAVYSPKSESSLSSPDANVGKSAMHQQNPHLNQLNQSFKRLAVEGEQQQHTFYNRFQIPEREKHLIGHHIYVVLNQMYPGMKDAVRITEMMLKMEDSELIMMMRDFNIFRSKIEKTIWDIRQSAKMPMTAQVHKIPA